MLTSRVPSSVQTPKPQKRRAMTRGGAASTAGRRGGEMATPSRHPHHSSHAAENARAAASRRRSERCRRLPTYGSPHSGTEPRSRSCFGRDASGHPRDAARYHEVAPDVRPWGTVRTDVLPSHSTFVCGHAGRETLRIGVTTVIVHRISHNRSNSTDALVNMVDIWTVALFIVRMTPPGVGVLVHTRSAPRVRSC